MKKFNYLNLPKLHIDDNLILGEVSYNPASGYKSYKIKSNNLIDQILKTLPLKISDLIDPEHDILFQTINSDLNNYIHKDGRAFAINYLIDPGGNNVETLFFNEDKDIVETNVMVQNSWALLETSKFHCVTNISTLRKAITISFGGYPNFQNPINDTNINYLTKLFYNPNDIS
jgi:hypothetical protein